MKHACIALLVLLCVIVPNYAKLVYVKNGSLANQNSCGNNVTNACPTIQSGMNNAVTGDTVYLLSSGGNFSGNGNTQLSITKTLSFSGDVGVRIDGQNNQIWIFSIADRIGAISFDSIEFWRASPALDISNSGPITVKNCKFISNNNQNDGGAVAVAGGQITFDSTSFTSNTASQQSDGGAVMVQDANVEFTNCTFTNNYATRRGGGVKLNGLSFGYFYSCNFTSNLADSSGAAISTETINANGELVIEGTVFKSNTAASRGGAIEIPSTLNSIHIWGSTFTSNIANGGDGGAIMLSGTPVTVPDIVSCVFTNNQATNTGGSSGGAIATSSVLLITDSIFTLNLGDTFSFSSGEGGGAIISSRNLTVSRCIFSYNYIPASGGAIYLTSGLLTLTDSVFIGNNVEITGGAVYVLTSNPAVIRNCTFTGNYATGFDAGALFITAPLSISDTVFRNNTAADSGGAMMISSASSVNFTNVLFDSNSASGVGGGLFCSSANVDLLLSNVNFTSNTAVQEGGGLRTDCATTIMDSYFSNNYAGYGGAMQSGGFVSVSGAEFTYNTANHGGAIATSSNGEVLTIVNSKIESNIGQSSAGGIYAGSSVSVQDSHFHNNTAKGPGGAVRVFPFSATVLTLTDVMITNNTATVGGALSLENSAIISIVDSEVDQNTPEDIRVRLTVDGKKHSISGASTMIGNLYVEYGNIDFDGNFDVEMVTLDGMGIIGGVGNASITQQFQWLNGSLTGIGYLTAADGSSVNVTGSGQHLITKPFVNQGAMSVPATSSCVTFANNATLYNQLYGKIYLGCNTTGTGNIMNAASIYPSNNVQIAQTYTETAASALVFYVRGTYDNDRINFASDASFVGSLRLENVAPYAPNVTNAFTVITSSVKNITGTFTYKISSNFSFTVQYGAQQVNATVFSLAGLTFPTCTQNSQCRSNSKCDANCVTGYCVGGSLTCSSGQSCNLAGGYCGSCATNVDCRSDQHCYSFCYSGVCQYGSACNSSQTCNTTTGYCDINPIASPSSSPASSTSQSTTNNAGNHSSSKAVDNTNTLIGVIVGVGAAVIVTVIIATIILKMKPSHKGGNANEMSSF